MGNSPSVSSPTSIYNDFLFAPICEEANGMRLSVLSAFARVNVDPWEEATRLAAMAKADAERALVSTIDMVSGRGWRPTEAAVVAAQLIRLLPQGGGVATSAAAKIAGLRTQRTSYWLVWLCFAMAVSFLSPHRQPATTDASKPTLSTKSKLNGGNDNISPAVASDQSLTSP